MFLLFITIGAGVVSLPFGIFVISVLFVKNTLIILVDEVIGLKTSVNVLDALSNIFIFINKGTPKEL